MIKPLLSRFNLTMIVVSLVIGVGIFRTPASVASNAETPFVFFSAWIFGGIISLCGALTFAEIGGRLPVAGGFYKIFSHCYHPAYAFMLNWAGVVINAASTASVAIIGAEYLRPLIFSAQHQDLGATRFLVILIVLILVVFNYSGVKVGAKTQNILSLLKISMILVFCLGIFFPASTSIHTDVIHVKSNLSWIQAFGLCLIPIFFSFGGYQNTVNFGADVKDPKRNIPKGIFSGITIVLILYLGINYAYCHVLGIDGMAGSHLVAANLAEAMFGIMGFKLAAVAIFISVLGFINTSLMSNPRIYYAMAEERTLPKVFGKVNSKTQVQEFALLFFLALIILSVFVFKSFEEILNYVMFIDTLALASAGAAIFIFRYKAKKEIPYAGFKIRFYPWIPLVFILTLIYVNINVLYSDPKDSLIGLGILILGYPIYRGMRKVNSRKM